MSKSRLTSGRIKKTTGASLSPDRYEFLDLSNAEPDLGIPNVDDSILIGDVDGSRAWVDIASYAEEFKGYTGSQGEIGYTGSQGDLGYTGSQGDIGYTGSAGADGFVGADGADGATGFTGSQGDIGYTGSKGVDGQFGGASFYYIFEADIYAGTIPDGYLRLDNASTSLVTFIALADTDRFNTNISSFIQTIDDSTSDIKGYIKLTEEGNPSNFTIFAVIDEHYIHDDHFHIPVSYVSGATSTPLDDTNVIVSFIVNGDKGDIGFTGSQGTIGFTGSQGDIGYTGSQGPAGEGGAAGSAGEVGFTGSQGNIGFTGSQGPQGPAGTGGTSGTDGTPGFTGSQGDTGFTGSQGNIGFTGSQGPAGTGGTDGTPGFTGSRGGLGFTGSQGFTGSKGAVVATISETPPAMPSLGDVWIDSATGIQYFYVADSDSAQWIEFSNPGTISPDGGGGGGGGGGSSNFTYGPDAPSSPVVGDRWYDSIDGAELVYTNDGNSSQWVEVAASGFLGPIGYTGSSAASGGPKITNIGITNSSYTLLDDTAVSIDGGYVKISGSAFEPGCQILINNVPAVSTTYISATEVRAQVPATSAGTYIVYLVNTDGGVAIRVNGITFSGTPTWVTSSGLLGEIGRASCRERV
jgi:hypothetical protein